MPIFVKKRVVFEGQAGCLGYRAHGPTRDSSFAVAGKALVAEGSAVVAVAAVAGAALTLASRPRPAPQAARLQRASFVACRDLSATLLGLARVCSSPSSNARRRCGCRRERRRGSGQRPVALERGARSRCCKRKARGGKPPRRIRSTGPRRRAFRAVRRSGVRGVLRRGPGSAYRGARPSRAPTPGPCAAAGRPRDRREAAATTPEHTAVALLGRRERVDAGAGVRGGGPHDARPGIRATLADEPSGLRPPSSVYPGAGDGA